MGRGQPAGAVIRASLAAVLAVLTLATSDAAMIEKVDYRGWQNTYRVANDQVAAYATADVGPRIIDFRTNRGDNVFHVRPAELGRAGEADWVFRGGWRLWVAPEVKETTYVPDNEPATAEVHDDRLRLIGPVQGPAGIRKTIEVSAVPDQPRIRVVSQIQNVSDKVLTYAAWSLSVMSPGGRALVPLDLGDPQAFADVRSLILWSYARWNDARYYISDRVVQIDQRKAAAAAPGPRGDASKIGVDSSQGWSAYLVGDVLYVKRFPHVAGANYPDAGSTVQVYSSAEFLELENLSPLLTLQPGETLTYPEEWSLFTGVSLPASPEAAIRALRRYLEQCPPVTS